MDKFKDLTTGAKLVLGATVLFLIVSFFNWFEYDGPGADQIEALGGDAGVSMWYGIGWLAGLLAVALIVWQALRLANLELEIGVTPAMITAGLAVLMLIFTFIRWIDKPGGDLVGRTFWSWLGLAFAIIVVVGAWMNMQAAGEGFADVRDRFNTMTAGSGGGAAAGTTAPPSAPAPDPTPDPTPPPAAAEPEAPAAPETPEPERPAGS